jgi:site-specific recombinase
LELDGRKIEEEEKERRREFVQTTGGGAAAAAVAALKLLIEGSHTHTTAGMNVHFFFSPFLSAVAQQQWNRLVKSTSWSLLK